jgi:hypothetical protein
LLTFHPAFPFANCVLRNPARFPWHQPRFVPPAFNDLIIYELHIGSYDIAPGNQDGSFFDVIQRVPYLAALGVNALELLPIQELRHHALRREWTDGAFPVLDPTGLGTQPNHTMLDPNGAMVGAKPGHMRLFGARRSDLGCSDQESMSPIRTGGNNYSIRALRDIASLKGPWNGSPLV